MNNIERNKELIQKYPFLYPRNVWTDEPVEDYDYSYTEWDGIPKGWKIAFGDMMLEEIGAALNRAGLTNEFRIDQIKEKFGQLRMYTHGGSREVNDIINKYSYLSENICIICGKPDVHMTNNGWFYPCCKECWEKENRRLSYEGVIDHNSPGVMANEMRWRQYSDGKYIDYRVDIRETAQKIREHWREIHD